MERLIVLVLSLVFLLWLPLFIASIVGWFITDIGLGYKLGFTITVCAIWLPIVLAWIHTK